MKRVKIMLTAIGVLAIVGGALAFKVKTVGTSSYCVTANLNSPICPVKVMAATFMPIGSGQLWKYVQVSPAASCPGNCTNVGFMGY